MMMIRSDPSLDWVLATTTTIEGRIEGARSFLPVCYYGACGSRLGEQKRRTTRASVCVEMDGHLLGMDARALLVAARREEVG